MFPSISEITETRMNLKTGVTTEGIILMDEDLYRKAAEDFASLSGEDGYRIWARFNLEPTAGWLERRKRQMTVSIAGRLEGISAADRSRYLPLRKLNGVTKWTVTRKDEKREVLVTNDAPTVYAVDCVASEHGIVSIAPMFWGYVSSDEDHPYYRPLESGEASEAGGHTGIISPPLVWLDASTLEAMSPLMQICTASR
jgi:hypothetical protein